MPTPGWLNTLAPSELWFLCFSLSGWFPGVHRLSDFTFLPGLLRPSWEGTLPLHPLERAPEAFVNKASPMPGALLGFCINQGISASFSLLYFLISRLRTTRFWSIKGPQHVMFAFSPCTIIYYIYAVFPEPFENKLCVFEKNSNMNSNIAYYANLVSITFLLKSITQLSIITKFSSLLSV